MNQSINTDSKNSKEPQQKYRLGTVSIKILGGLNRFYRLKPVLQAASYLSSKSFNITENLKPHEVIYFTKYLDTRYER